MPVSLAWGLDCSSEQVPTEEVTQESGPGMAEEPSLQTETWVPSPAPPFMSCVALVNSLTNLCLFLMCKEG